VDQRFRSRRAEIAHLRAELRAKGASVRQVAGLIRARYNVNSRVAYRHAHGLTQQQVADRWNDLWPSIDGELPITHKHISYWEAWPAATGRAPSAETLNRLARIYRCNAADLLDGEDYSEPTSALVPIGFPPSSPVLTGDVVTAEPSDVLTRVDAFIASSGSLLTARESDYHQLVKELIEWACRMKRRDILQWLSSAAAAAAAAPVLDGLDAGEWYRTADAFVRPQRVDGRVVDHIEAVLWRCMRQDDTLGPQAALDTVLAQRTLVRGLLPQTPAHLRDRLLSLYADLCGFAGWLSYDLGNFDAAASYYEAGRAAAHEAHNTELGALILCNMSQLATWRGQARIGIDHAVAAQGWAMQTDDLPLRAYTHDVAARAYAMDGNRKAALTAIDRAKTALAAKDTEQPTLVYFYGTGQLASTESNCLLHLGEPIQAAVIAETAMKTIDPSFVRNLAMVSLRLGICRLQMSKPDVPAAAEAIGQAVQLAAHNRSVRLVERLGRSWQQLTPWHELTEVQEVRERMVAYGLA
jgi:tetratricopeptide (TPR) repeat protein